VYRVVEMAWFSIGGAVAAVQKYVCRLCNRLVNAEFQADIARAKFAVVLETLLR